MHANAFGLGILDSKFDEFVNHSEVYLADLDFTPQYNVDFVYNGMPDAEDMFSLGDYEDMWGQGIDEPVIAVTNAVLTDDMVMLMSRGKNPTIKINFPNGSAAIKFKSSEEEFNRLCIPGGCVHINLLGRVEINRYMGKETPQLIVEDYEILSTDAYIF